MVTVVPIKGESPRLSRWRWWEALARVGICVRHYYVGADYASSSNASAGPGSDGQCIVHFGGATIERLKSGHLFSPNDNPALNALLACGFRKKEA